MDVLRHVPGLGGACHTVPTPRHFSLSPQLDSTRPPFPSSAVSRYTIVDRDLLPSPKQCSLLSRSQVPPLSSDFFTSPSRCSRPTTPRTRRPNVTNHIIQSHHPISDPKIPAHLPQRILLCLALTSPQNFQLTSFPSPRLTFVSPPLRAPRNSNCRPSMCSRHCQSPSPAHLSRVSSPLHGYLGRTGLNLVSPTVSYSDAHVKMLSGLSRRPLRPLPSSHLIPFRSSRPHIDSRFYSNLATLYFNAFVTTYSVHVLGPSNSSVIQIT